MPSTFRHLRAQYYDADPVGARALPRFHVRQQETAGLIATETRHPPRFDIPRHAHVLHSFYVVLKGALTEYSQRSEQTLERGSIVFTPAGHIHGNTFYDRGGRCFLVELTTAWSERVNVAGVSLQRPLFDSAGELLILALRLHREFREPDAVSALAIEGLTSEILAGFARRSDRQTTRDLPRWLLQARELLHDRFAERLNLADLAQVVGVHPVHLARVFRQRFRCTPGEYQRNLRVQHAALQLAATRRPLAEIALAAGFTDQAHFTRVFKARTGRTPASFRAGCPAS